MRTLLLLRHAKSSWKKPALRDHDRPLNARGRRDAPRMARLLTTEGLIPDVIACSTALRARRTAELVLESAAPDVPIVFTEDLYLAAPRAMLVVLRGMPAEAATVMLVGHNPGMESLLEVLTGRDETMPTAALARLDLDIDDWVEIDAGTGARLVKVWRPKEIDPQR